MEDFMNFITDDFMISDLAGESKNPLSSKSLYCRHRQTLF